jgi:hypothetical protein
MQAMANPFPGSGSGVHQALGKARHTHYYFSFESKLKLIEPDKLARRPGGTRVCVEYDAASSLVIRLKRAGRASVGTS